jgi:UDP-glucose 4-epimerase
VYGLKAVSLRLTNTYGPRMRIKDARQTFLGVWLRRVVEADVFEVWGGEQKRDLTYVDDVVDAMLYAAADSRTDGTGQCQYKEFPEARKRIDIGDYFADDRRFRELTGWAPRVSLGDGLARSVEYYRQCLAAYV